MLFYCNKLKSFRNPNKPGMGPKKRERLQQVEEQKVPYDHVQSDHELFLQAFEKPTQIYRYLRTRSLYSPVFLQRTLNYMVGRCQRKANTRRNFTVDSILTRVQAEHERRLTASYMSEYLQLTFSGFFDKENMEIKTADVEVSLLKICYKKRKDVSSPVKEITTSKVSIPCNPLCAGDRSTLPAISLYSDSFSLNGSNSIKSYVLRIQVSVKMSTPIASTRTPHKADTNSDLENQGPPRKKLRSSRDSGNAMRSSEDSQRDSDFTLVKTYLAELVIYDKRHRCLLSEGDYELVLEEEVIKSASGKQSQWESVNDEKECVPLEVFTKGPILKFSLTWKKTTSFPEPDRGHPVQQEFIREEITQNNCIDIRCNDLKMFEKRAKEITSPAKKKRIFYQFLYNNNMRQQTEAMDDSRCPWCYLSCLSLAALLSHLRYCHSRFNFMYVDHPKGGRIDVSINDCYDGSYVGNPQDLHSHIGYAFSRNGPVRRMSVTHLLVSRRSKPVLGITDFLEGDGDCQKSRHNVQGHNRLYYHTLTCRPVRPSEIDNDSEEENYPNWLRQKTQNMIDEFTDVNEGEKEVMKMWNLHVMQHNYISDFQIPKACSTFIEEYGAEVIRQNLRRNFLLHLINLSDFGLLRPSVMHRTAVKFFQLCKKMADVSKTSAQSIQPTDSGEKPMEDATTTAMQPCHIPSS